MYWHRKNEFAKVAKNLSRSNILSDINLKIILLAHQNNLKQNYVGHSNWLLSMSKLYCSSSCLKFLRNYFDGPTKLFSDLVFS